MRLFIALDIDDGIRERIQRFVEGVSGFASEARWVRPESMHVTLKFIGEKPAEVVEEIKRAVSAVKGRTIRDQLSRVWILPYCKIGASVLGGDRGRTATGEPGDGG